MKNLPIQYVKANGIEFAYLERGSGPLVLCLHGFPDHARSFEPVLNALADAGFRAVAPWMRGYLPTGLAPRGDYTPISLARDAMALADKFEAKQFSLVGHDWGAAACYLTASLRPDRVSRMVTAAVPHLRRFFLRPTLAQIYRSRYMAQFQFDAGAKKLATREYFSRMIREWSPGFNDYQPYLDPVFNMLQDPERRNALVGVYRAMPKTLLDIDAMRVALSPIMVPTRVIYGAEDGCIAPEMFQGQAHLFTQEFEALKISDAGHFMHIEQPDDFATRVVEFIARRDQN